MSISQQTNERHSSIRSSLLVGFGVSALSFLLLGGVTALFKNQFFTRMTPVRAYDYVILVFTSLLFGAYVGLRWYHRNTVSSAACSYAAGGGVMGGVLSFGCALCNKLFLLLLGVVGTAAYIMPIQPYLGILGVLLLAFAVYKEIKRIPYRKRYACPECLLEYAEQTWADKCAAWCRAHQSCNLEITRHSLQRGA